MLIAFFKYIWLYIVDISLSASEYTFFDEDFFRHAVVISRTLKM